MTYLILAALIWGSSFPVIRYALGDISPMLFVFVRFALAFVILLPRYRSLADLRGLFRRDLFLISVPNAVAFILQFKAQELTTASKAALFVNSSPIFVAIFAAVLFRKRFGPRQLVAMVIAMAGVVVTSTGLDFSGFEVINIGDLLCVVVGACWALFILFSRDVVKRYGALELSQGLYFWSAIMALPLIGFETTRFAWSAVPSILYLTIFTTILAYVFYLKGVRFVSPLSISIIILIEVVVAYLIAHFLLSETFTGVETLGVVMVMVGVVMVLRK